MATATCPFIPPLQSPLDLAAHVGRAAADSDEQEVLEHLLTVVRRFCTRYVDSAAIDAQRSLGAELRQQAAELGWFGLTVPESHGGAGLSLQGAARIVVELSGFNGSLGTCIGLHSGLALHALLYRGESGLRARYLPEVARGERIAAFAATEPNAGSDLTAIRTTLAQRDGQLRLTGSKCYVTNGGICGLVTVLARSPGLGGARAGHTLVAVDPSWPGVARQREENKLGLKGASTITIDFDEVAIPADHLLGAVSKGMDHAHEALTWGRTFMAAGCLGTATAALAQARAHTAERVQFNRPLAALPLVREQTADALADSYSSESVIRLVCALHDAGLSDIGLESSIAKIYASETAWGVVDRSLQLMGGTGYIEDAGMARRLRDVRVTRIFEGANDVLRLHLGSSVLGWRGAPWRSAELAPRLGPALADAGARFDALLAQLLTRLAAIRSELAFRLYQQPALQVAMADAIIALFAMLAVLLRSLPAAAEAATPGGAGLARLALVRLESRARLALERLQQTKQAELDALVAGALDDGVESSAR